MDLKSLLEPLITLGSVVAAILAWLAKLKWSKEYSAAKEEIIKSKDAEIHLLKEHYIEIRDQILKAKDAEIVVWKAQIENLKDLNPVKSREYFTEVKRTFEERIEQLQDKLAKAEEEVAKKPQGDDEVQKTTQKITLEKKELVALSELIATRLDEYRSVQKDVTNLVGIDTLTGLPNRFALQNKMDDLLSARREFVLAFLDLDNFKAVNDNFGHAAGDQVLIEFVALVHEKMSGNDFFARIGGDEFVILFTESSLKESTFAMQRVVDTVKIDPEINGKYKLRVSAGLSTSDVGDAVAILKAADYAMYQAKVQGKGMVVTSVTAPLDDINWNVLKAN